MKARQAVSTLAAILLTLLGVVAGAGGYYAATNLPTSTVTSTSTVVLTSTKANTTLYVPSYIQTPGGVAGGSLFITAATFSGGNVTVSFSNSGGGTPIVGYGNTGQIARWVGSIIISDGGNYSRWAWTCPPTAPCAVAPGPWRYFTFEGNSTTLAVPWNQGPGAYYGLPETVNGLTSVPVTYHYRAGATYYIFLENTNSTIVYEQVVTAPAS